MEIESTPTVRLWCAKGSLLSQGIVVAELKGIRIDKITEFAIMPFDRRRDPIESWIEIEFERADIKFDHPELLGFQKTPDGDIAVTDTNAVPLFDIVTCCLNNGIEQEVRVIEVSLEGFKLTTLLRDGKIPLLGRGKELIISR